MDKQRLEDLKLHARLNHRSVSDFAQWAIERGMAETSRPPVVASPAWPSSDTVSPRELAMLSYAYHTMAYAYKRLVEAEDSQGIAEAQELDSEARRRLYECSITPASRPLVWALRLAERRMYFAVRRGGKFVDAARGKLAEVRKLLELHRIPCY